MAGDWIKMRVSLPTHPKVIRAASALKSDRYRVVGGLLAMWAVFDQHSIDGLLEGYTTQTMDETLGWRGFSSAIEAIGWLDVSSEGLVAPEFDEHNSKSAKRRATDNDRKKSARDADKTARGSWNEDGQVSASDAEKKEPREELEKKKPPVVPQRGTVGEGRFPEFWAAWPASDRKQDRKKCLGAWKRKGFDSQAETILSDVAARRQSRKWQDGFEPAPYTYLNGERWNDGEPINGSHEGFL